MVAGGAGRRAAPADRRGQQVRVRGSTGASSGLRLAAAAPTLQLVADRGHSTELTSGSPEATDGVGRSIAAADGRAGRGDGISHRSVRSTCRRHPIPGPGSG